MRSLVFTSVAMTALIAGVVAADAQQAPPDRRDQPSATEQKSQQPPRARDGARQDQPGARSQREPERQPPARSTTGQGSDRQADQPRAQQPQQPQQSQQERGREQPARSTAGQANERQADQPRSQPQRGDARDQAPAARERTGQDRSRGQSRDRATTGQSQQDRAGTSGSRPSEMTRDAPRSGDAQRQDTAREPAGRAAAERDRGTSGSLRLSEQDRSRVSASFSTRIDRMNVRPLARSQVSVSVGAPLPRGVRLHAVPRDIVAIYPQFRGHRFVVVEDEIVIVEPRSQRVVTVLPMGGDRRTVGSGPRETMGSGARDVARSTTRETIGAAPASRVQITPRVREEIRTVVMQQPACRLEQRIDFMLFIPLPRTVEICELPQQIVSEAPELRRYRYVVRGDEIALVDPEEYRVVEVIR